MSLGHFSGTRLGTDFWLCRGGALEKQTVAELGALWLSPVFFWPLVPSQEIARACPGQQSPSSGESPGSAQLALLRNRRSEGLSTAHALPADWTVNQHSLVTSKGQMESGERVRAADLSRLCCHGDTTLFSCLSVVLAHVD